MWSRSDNADWFQQWGDGVGGESGDCGEVTVGCDLAAGEVAALSTD